MPESGKSPLNKLFKHHHINSLKVATTMSIIRVYTQSLPQMRFIGKKYSCDDSVDGSFSGKWEEWFENDRFSEIQTETDFYEDADAYIGLCRILKDGSFEYWIGVFAPAGSRAPEGYLSLDFEAADVAVCWVKGKEPDIYMEDCTPALKENGFEWKTNGDGIRYCFERYCCPRFTEPDEDGNVILDQCFFI